MRNLSYDDKSDSHENVPVGETPVNVFERRLFLTLLWDCYNY